MFVKILSLLFHHTPFFYLVQSVWRDEAFSYFMAKPNPLEIIIKTANDFNPPLYYLLLHFWLNIGQTDVILRMLSFLFHLFTSYFAYLLAKKIMSKKMALFTGIFTLFNPMLIIYAFEIRMYALYALLSMSTFYFYYIKKWKYYIFSAILGLYTHSFFVLIIISLALYTLMKKSSRKLFIYTLLPLIGFLFWVPVIISQFLKSTNSWMFPVDIQLIKSVLGNLFTGYEGTPGNWWKYTAILSLIICVFFLLSLRRKKESLYFLSIIFFPLAAILGYSLFKRPIYVNRYLIFITLAQIFLIALSIDTIKNKYLKFLLASFWFAFITYINIFNVPYHTKTDFKSTFAEINNRAIKADFVYTKTPISFLESVFYYKYPKNVYVYNPKNITIPNYIGVTVLFPNVSRYNFPPPDSKTYLIYDDAGFDIVINK